jgi:hypothetical protein
MGGRGGSSGQAATYDYLISRPWMIRRGLPAQGSIEDQVIRAYASLNPGGQDGATDNVSFVNLRRALPRLSREQFDLAIRRLVDSGIGIASEEENLKTLTEVARRAAVNIGGTKASVQHRQKVILI